MQSHQFVFVKAHRSRALESMFIDLSNRFIRAHSHQGRRSTTNTLRAIMASLPPTPEGGEDIIPCPTICRLSCCLRQNNASVLPIVFSFLWIFNVIHPDRAPMDKQPMSSHHHVRASCQRPQAKIVHHSSQNAQMGASIFESDSDETSQSTEWQRPRQSER